MKCISALKTTLSVSVILLLGIISIVFFQMYLCTFTGGFFYDNKQVISIATTACICILGVLAMVFYTFDNSFIYKFTIIVLVTLAIVFAVAYFLKISGVADKIDSIEDLRNYVASFGYNAVIIYIAMHVLQVVVLPIPGFIAVGTGVALFGPLKTALFSLIGIMLGSLIAFFIGRFFGYKVVAWLVGKNTLDKWIKKVKNKDKVVLTFMFLFPFFPDDVLCFVAGLSSMSTLYFIIMIFVCRIISVFTTAYSLNGNIIPFNTWWGILLWILVFALTAIVTIYLYKYGDKIEKFIKNKLSRKKKNEGNSSR